MRKTLLSLTMAMVLTQPVVLSACTRLQGGVPDTEVLAGTQSAGPGELTPDDGAKGLARSVPATEDYDRLIGRTCRQDGVTWLPQSGSAVEFSVTGSVVRLEIAGDDHVTLDEAVRQRYAVLVDDEVVLEEVLGERSRTVEVFSGDTSRSAVVRVIHLSEARNGAIGVRSISVSSDAEDPVTPTAAKDLRISFVGDSITCGYGVETDDVNGPFATSTENFMKTYAYLAAQELDADYETLCYSGHGIVSGWTATVGEAYRGALIPPLYDVVAAEYPEAWGFAAHPSDVVVINLGTNDYSYTGTDEDLMGEFAQGYADFLMHVRACNPDAWIVCTMGAMGGETLYPSIEQAIENVRNRTGDMRITSYLSTEIDVEAEGIGIKGHPTLATQEKNARELVEVIRSLELGSGM